jgi:RNA polymerase sigma-70 factor (ECF subfamily)
MSEHLPGAGAEPDDAELIARVLRGQRDVYQVLVRRYQGSLFRVAYSMVQDPDAAEDLVQDAFVRAYVNLAGCKDRHRFRFWLLTTLRNRALDYIKEKRRRDVSLSDDDVLRHVDARAPLPEDHAERGELRAALLSAMNRLSPALREAFVLRHVEEHSFEEIAALLGTGVSAVKMRVHRARIQLQEWLAPEPAGAGEPPAGGHDVTEAPRGSSVDSEGEARFAGPTARNRHE